jgi:hypothetical protein
MSEALTSEELNDYHPDRYVPLTPDITISCGPPNKIDLCLVQASYRGEVIYENRRDPHRSEHRREIADAVCRKADYIDDDGRPFDNAIVEIDEKLLAAAAVGNEPSTESHRPVLQSMSDIVSREIAWLWPNRFALGKLSLLIGEPGNGKSYCSLDTASRISISAPWPDGSGNAPFGSVILMGVEDDLADTVKPRLEAAGADVKKIIALTGVANKDESGEYERTVDLRRDIPILDTAFQRHPDTRAIIIDPISAFMGKTDSHVNSEVRETLAPLAQLAEKYAIAVIAITHLRKGESSALHRAMGSVAFTAAARSVWAIAKDKRDPEGRRRLLLPVKSNISEDLGGLAFTLTKRHGLESAMPHIEYEPEPITDTNADDQLSNEPRKRGPDAEALDEAKEFLRDALASGPQPTKQVESDAKLGHSITHRTLERARKALGVKAYRDTPTGPWLLRLDNHSASQSANCSEYKQLGDLGGVAEASKKTTKTTPHNNHSARLFVRGDVGSNGHDVDAINAMLCEAGETDDAEGF